MIIKTPKKIILIVVDALRAQNLGIYGKKPSPTPNIDSLSKNSILFKNAYATITKTDPSITSIMTGKYPISNGLVNHGTFISPQEEQSAYVNITLAEILKKNYFKTFAFDWIDRWHKKGFDYYSGTINPNSLGVDFLLVKLPIIIWTIRVIDKIFITIFKREFFYRLYYSLFLNPKSPFDPAENIIDSAISSIKKDNSKCFYYIHLWDTHWPYIHSRGLKSFFRDSIDDAYNSEIKYIDMQIGRLINYLQEKQLMKDTLFILTGDHGENLYGHDSPLTHQNLYDDVVKIPLIISHPKFKRRKVKVIFQHTDILPTVLDILNIESKSEIDGKSLLSIIQNKEKPKRIAYIEDLTYRKLRIGAPALRHRGIRLGKYKYIETICGSQKSTYSIIPSENCRLIGEELYDLDQDPNEKNNLVFKLPQVKKKLRGEFKNLINTLCNIKLKQSKGLYKKVLESKKVIKKALKSYDKKTLAIAWKGGKDTTVMMHIIKQMYGEIPFPVFFNDTTLEFKETYSFIQEIKKLWSLNLVTLKHDTAKLNEYYYEKDSSRRAHIARLMKIDSIERARKKFGYTGFMLGIRRDENPARANEVFFSKRKDHIRIHPMLNWTEADIWEYIHTFGVPYNSLYDKGYRSVGEKPFTKKTLVLWSLISLTILLLSLSLKYP